MKQYLPIMLDVTNKNILILGAGKASAEKLRTLAQLGKPITVISKTFCDEFLSKDWLILKQKPYEYGDLKGFDVVYSGVNDKIVEHEIFKEAKERNVLINFIDQVENSDFISAASIIRKNLTIFISTYGKTPGGAKRIRQKIESQIQLDELDLELEKLILERERKKNAIHSL